MDAYLHAEQPHLSRYLAAARCRRVPAPAELVVKCVLQAAPRSASTYVHGDRDALTAACPPLVAVREHVRRFAVMMLRRRGAAQRLGSARLVRTTRPGPRPRIHHLTDAQLASAAWYWRRTSSPVPGSRTLTPMIPASCPQVSYKPQ